MAAVKLSHSSNVSITSCGQCKTASETLKKCTGCFSVAYCSRNCQKLHWPEHKKICVIPSQQKPTESERIWGMIEKEKASWLSNASGPNLFGEERITPLVEQYFTSPEKGKVALDLGCGQGMTSLHLLRRGWTVIAVDRAQACINALQKNANTINRKWIETGQLTLVNKPLLDFEINIQPDLVVIADVLPYIDPSKVQDLWNRIFHSLKEGGKIVGSLFCRVNERSLTLQAMGAWFVESQKAIESLVREKYQLEVCRQRVKKYPSCVFEFMGIKKGAQ